MSNSSTLTPVEQMEKLLIAQQGVSMDAIMQDRCLLRRNMRASQNKVYGLSQEELPECEEDDMGVQIGDTDNSQTTTHNHYHGDCGPTEPVEPQPCPTVPPRVKVPWWLMILLIVPWIVLASLLVGWIIASYPEAPQEKPPVVWRLDIDSSSRMPEGTLRGPTGE